VRAVKGSGGIILVQDPNEAEYSSMPRSAIATGVADFVLPIPELVARLVELIAVKRNGASIAAPPNDEDLLRRLLAHLRVRTGHDFSKYKRSTVLRRIARRMQVVRTDSLHGYYELLRDSAEEAQALLGDLLISVTTFFRDGEPFELLKKLALSKLFEGRDMADTVRVWVAGCATGEEAYSVAMLLLEEASKHVCGRRSRYSAPTWMRGPSRPRGKAAIRRRSKPMSAKNGCGASLPAKATATACGKRCARWSSSRSTIS
jgi:two-component system CheB/CheR fusion protein